MKTADLYLCCHGVAGLTFLNFKTIIMVATCMGSMLVFAPASILICNLPLFIMLAMQSNGPYPFQVIDFESVSKMTRFVQWLVAFAIALSAPLSWIWALGRFGITPGFVFIAIMSCAIIRTAAKNSVCAFVTNRDLEEGYGSIQSFGAIVGTLCFLLVHYR